MRYVMQVALMMLLAILGSVGVVGIVLHLVPNDVFPARDAVALLQGLATVAAVALGALFAYRKLELFRDFEPHLTVSHDLSHRRVGQSYVHIGVTATLHNSSKVKVEIRQGEFLLQQIAPITDAAVELLLSAQLANGDEIDQLQWPVLDEVERVWAKNELVIEPGGSHQETYEFIAPVEVATVLVYTYFYNPGHLELAQSAEGWSATSFYDIVVGPKP